MQGLYAQLTRGFHLPSIYIDNKCNGMQGPYDQMMRGVHKPSIYICI